MSFLQQTGAAVLLVLIALTIQCGGAAALIIWIRSIPRETQEVRVFRCAALVMDRHHWASYLNRVMHLTGQKIFHLGLNQTQSSTNFT